MLNAEIHLPRQWTSDHLPDIERAAEAAYLDRYLAAFSKGALCGKRIAIYEHSSVARDILHSLLTSLGADVISLGRTDTFVPIDTEAVTMEDAARAKGRAEIYDFDAIVSTDGDADRPLIGDENGRWLRGDIVGVLCAKALGVNVVVTPVSSNTVAESCGYFADVIRTRIGSPYVIEGMKIARQKQGPNTTVAGYEANGGFLLGTNARIKGNQITALPTRDAILPILTLLTTASARRVPLSVLESGLPRRYTASDRVQNVAATSCRALIADLRQNPFDAGALIAPDAGSVQLIDETDGFRVTFASGEIVHLRASGNAPELRCYTEANDVARAEHLCAECLRRLQNMLKLGNLEK